jgi:hypothetical protein
MAAPVEVTGQQLLVGDQQASLKKTSGRLGEQTLDFKRA